MKKLLFLTFGVLIILTIVFSYSFIDPNLIYLRKLYTGFAFSQRGVVTSIYITIVTLLFLLFLRFMDLYKRKEIGRKEILVLIGISALLVLAYPAMLSYDIFNYVFTSKVLFFYHENPYIMMPINFLGDPLLNFTRAVNKTALYGPIWTLISGVPFYLGFGNFILTLFLFKVFVALFYLGTVYLVYKFTKNLENVLFFALNPLVFIETFISGHNDIVMMFFAVFAFYLFKNKNYVSSFLLIITSIFVKFASLFILPTYFYAVYKQYKNKPIDFEKIFLYSSILMLVIFYLSFIREEIYPWYGIWFLLFLSLTKITKIKLSLVTIFSFCLMLRYVPFMYLGTYFGPTPAIKIIITFVPISAFIIYYLFKNKAWKSIKI